MDDVDWLLVLAAMPVICGFAIVGISAIAAVVDSHRRDAALLRELQALPGVLVCLGCGMALEDVPCRRCGCRAVQDDRGGVA